MAIKPQIFLSYSHVDEVRVRRLYNDLIHAGFKPWMDSMDILPGSRWEFSLREAIRRADFLLICISKNSVNKRGYLQRELKYALDLYEERLESETYLIPVRLEECEVPDSLRVFQWVDVYQEDGLLRLTSALRVGIERRGVKSELIQSIYNIDNIRELFVEEFTTEDLHRVFYDLPTFRPVYDQLLRETNKVEIVNRLLESADRPFQFEALLDWVKKNSPLAYSRHQPYHRDDYETQPEDYLETDTRPLDNPYVVGNPIQPSNMKVFLGRFDIAKTIISEIKKGTQKPSMLLYGRRRMGKTSALLNISNLVRDPSFIHVYVSGQSAKFHTNVNFCYYLVQAINEKFQQSSIDTSIFQQRGFLAKGSFEENPVLMLSEFFDECEALLEAHNMYCLLAIDEYEEIDSYINTSPGIHHEKNITKELLVELRDTLQHKPRLMFLFAGTHFLRDLSKVDWTSIFINVKTLHISFLDRRDSELLLTQPVPELRYESDDLIERILYLTGGQPYLLQAVASELINTLNFKGKRIVTEDILSNAIDEVSVKYNIFFDYIWDIECSGTKHRELLKKVTGKEDGLSEIALTDYQDDLRDLIRREVLKNDKGTIRSTMPIMKFWMKRNQHIL